MSDGPIKLACCKKINQYFHHLYGKKKKFKFARNTRIFLIRRPAVEISKSPGKALHGTQKRWKFSWVHKLVIDCETENVLYILVLEAGRLVAFLNQPGLVPQEAGTS
jgi:hypothetical protein